MAAASQSSAPSMDGPMSSGDVGIEQVNVLVTGFGTFRDQPDVNASWLIAKSLPSTLPPSHVHPTMTKIIVHTEPIEVTYATVHRIMASLYEGPTHYDIILHMGVSADHDHYKLESDAARTSIDHSPTDRDASGMLPNIDEQPEYWHTSPQRLYSNAHLPDVHRRWQEEAYKSDVRISRDAGSYLCEYLFYGSLAYFRNQGNDRKQWAERTTVSFLHVPASLEDERIDEGRGVVVALIHALVDSRRSRDGNFDFDHLTH